MSGGVAGRQGHRPRGQIYAHAERRPYGSEVPGLLAHEVYSRLEVLCEGVGAGMDGITVGTTQGGSPL